jgi:hypothetical protein
MVFVPGLLLFPLRTESIASPICYLYLRGRIEVKSAPAVVVICRPLGGPLKRPWGLWQAYLGRTQAEDIISKNPQSLQLCFLSTLAEISTEKNSTIIFPLPVELLKALTYNTSEEKKQGLKNRESREIRVSISTLPDKTKIFNHGHGG